MKAQLRSIIGSVRLQTAALLPPRLYPARGAARPTGCDGGGCRVPGGRDAPDCVTGAPALRSAPARGASASDLRLVEGRVQMATRCRDADILPKVANAGAVSATPTLQVQIMHNGIKVLAGGYYRPLDAGPDRLGATAITSRRKKYCSPSHEAPARGRDHGRVGADSGASTRFGSYPQPAAPQPHRRADPATSRSAGPMLRLNDCERHYRAFSVGTEPARRRP